MVLFETIKGSAIRVNQTAQRDDEAVGYVFERQVIPLRRLGYCRRVILDKPIAENGRFLELHSVTWSRENSKRRRTSKDGTA